MEKENKDNPWCAAAIKERDREWVLKNAHDKAEKSERLSNFAIGFSVFTLIFILFVETVIAKR